MPNYLDNIDVIDSNGTVTNALLQDRGTLALANQIATNLANEITNRGNADTALQTAIDALSQSIQNMPSIFEHPEQYGAVGDGVTDDSDAIEACCTHARYNGYGVAFKGVTYGCSRAIELTGNFIIGVPNRSTLKYIGSSRISSSDGAFVTRTGYDRGLTYGMAINGNNLCDIAIDASYGSYGASIQHRFDHVWVEYYDAIGFKCDGRAEDYMVNCGTTPTGHPNSDGLCAGVFNDYGGPIIIQDSNLTGGYIKLGAQYAQLINCVTTGVHLTGVNSVNDISFIGGYCHNDRLNGGNVTVESTTRIRNLTFIGTYIQNDEVGMKAILGGTGSWDATQITLLGCHIIDTLASPTFVNFLASDIPSPSHSTGCAISLQGCFLQGGNVIRQNSPISGWRYDTINTRNTDYLNHLADLTIFPHFMQQRDILKYWCSPITNCANGNTVITTPFVRNSGIGLFITISTSGDYYVGLHGIVGGTIDTNTPLLKSGDITCRFGGGTTTQAVVVENASSDVKSVYVAFIGLTLTA